MKRILLFLSTLVLIAGASAETLTDDLTAFEPNRYQSAPIPASIKDTLFKLGAITPSAGLPIQADLGKALSAVEVTGITFANEPKQRKVILAGGFVRRVGQKLPRSIYPGPGFAEITAIERKTISDENGIPLVVYNMRLHVERPLEIEGASSVTTREDLDLNIFLRNPPRDE